MSQILDELCGKTVQKSILATFKNDSKPVEILLKAHGTFKRNELDGVLEEQDFKVFRGICTFGALCSMDPIRQKLLNERFEFYRAQDQPKYNQVVASIAKMQQNQQLTTLMKAAKQIDLSEENYKLSYTKYIKDPVASKDIVDTDMNIGKAFSARRHAKDISEATCLEAWKHYISLQAKLKQGLQNMQGTVPDKTLVFNRSIELARLDDTIRAKYGFTLDQLLMKGEELKINEREDIKKATSLVEASLDLDRQKNMEAAKPSPEFLAAVNKAAAQQFAPVQLSNGLIKPDVFVETRKLYTRFYAAALQPMSERWATERRGHLRQKKVKEATEAYRAFIKMQSGLAAILNQEIYGKALGMTQQQAMNNMSHHLTPEWTKQHGAFLDQITSQANPAKPKEMTRDLVVKGVNHFIQADLAATKKMISMKETGVDRNTIEMRTRQEKVFAEDACFLISGFVERDVTYNVRRLKMAEGDQEYLDMCEKHQKEKLSMLNESKARIESMQTKQVASSNNASTPAPPVSSQKASPTASQEKPKEEPQATPAKEAETPVTSQNKKKNKRKGKK